MRYNPCGRIVDIAAMTYTRSCRFLRDNDAVSTVRWRDARHDALTLDEESIILSTQYECDPWLPSEVGEVYDAPYNFRLGISPTGSGRDHVCGTVEDFARGGTYEPDLPPVRYAVNQLPLCCNPALAAFGGAGVSGRSTYVVIDPTHVYGGAGAGGRSEFSPVVFEDPTSGGGEGGGTSGDLLTFTDATSGGGEGGGAAGDELTFTDPTGGGGEGGGTAGDEVEFTDSTSGGGEGGGTAGDYLVTTDATSGGGEGGGSAGDQLAFTDATTGGGEGGGAATGNVISFTDATTGGGEGGGTAGDVLTFTDATTGGGEGGGTAGDVFDPGQPTPGNNCAGAPTVTQGTTYSYSISSGMGVEQWFKFTIPTTGNWHIATTGLTMMGAGLQVYKNGSCPLPNLLGGWTFGPPRWFGAATAGDNFWLKFTAGIGGPFPYTFVWDSGL